MNGCQRITLAPITALVVALGAGTAAAGECYDQPNMAGALRSLRDARMAMDLAENNNGGWRDAALRAINTAISEAERGCAYSVQQEAPPVVYYSEPPPEPLVVYDPRAIWYFGPHHIPSDGWCNSAGAHSHDYAPEWGDRFSFVNGYYYYLGEPGAGAVSYVYYGAHPNPWGGWCYHNTEHRHYYAPRQNDAYVWEGGRYRFTGSFDNEYNMHRNEYDDLGHRRVGGGYNEHSQYIQAHPPPVGKSPAELQRMQREQEERARQAALQRQEAQRQEQLRLEQQRAQQQKEQQKINGEKRIEADRAAEQKREQDKMRAEQEKQREEKAREDKQRADQERQKAEMAKKQQPPPPPPKKPEPKKNEVKPKG